MIKSFQDKTPHFGQNVYISETADVIGDVTLGDSVNIWFGAVVRGDIQLRRRAQQLDDRVVFHA